MKRVGVYLLVFFCTFLCGNVIAFASEVEQYDIDVTINDDGSSDVIEHVKLSTSSDITINNNYINCNGLNKILYVGMSNDLYGSDIYVPSAPKDVSIVDADGNKIGFETEETSDGEKYVLIGVKEFYLSYSFDNFVVGHNDANEIYYNFYRNKFSLNIVNSTLTIKLPDRSSYLKATDYKYGNNIDIENNKTVIFKYTNPKDINTRVLFDSSMVTVLKKTDTTIKNFVETDINNGLINKIKYWACIAITVIFYLNFIRLVISVIVKYGGNKKYKPVPKLDETLVKRYNYAGINYLINKDITVDALVSGILDLINSGKLNIIRNESGAYSLVRGNISSNLSVEEEYLMNFLLEIIDKKYKSDVDLISLDKLKKFCQENSTVSSFIVNFNVWRTIQVKNSREYKFMVGNEYYFSLRKSMIFSYVLLILNIFAQTYFTLGIIAFIPTTLLVNVMVKLTKRSVFAEDVYKEVINFKAGLGTIGRTTTDPYRWDMFLIAAVSMDAGIETERLIKQKLREGTLFEHYNSNLINAYRTYPRLSIVEELLPVFREAYKKSFFIYTPKRKNNL